jgi:hypothetical protein
MRKFSLNEKGILCPFFCPPTQKTTGSARGWMRTRRVSYCCAPGLMLRRIPLLADNPPKP